MFHRSVQYQILWQSVHWEPNLYTRADGRIDIHEVNRLFSRFMGSLLINETWLLY